MSNYTKRGNVKFQLDTVADETVLDNWANKLVDKTTGDLVHRLMSNAELKAIETDDNTQVIPKGYKSMVIPSKGVVHKRGYAQGSRYTGKVKVVSRNRKSEWLQSELLKDVKSASRV